MNAEISAQDILVDTMRPSFKESTQRLEMSTLFCKRKPPTALPLRKKKKKKAQKSQKKAIYFGYEIHPFFQPEEKIVPRAESWVFLYLNASVIEIVKKIGIIMSKNEDT